MNKPNTQTQQQIIDSFSGNDVVDLFGQSGLLSKLNIDPSEILAELERAAKLIAAKAIKAEHEACVEYVAYRHSHHAKMAQQWIDSGEDEDENLDEDIHFAYGHCVREMESRIQ